MLDGLLQFRRERAINGQAVRESRLPVLCRSARRQQREERNSRSAENSNLLYRIHESL